MKFEAQWILYSILCLLCFAGYVIVSKLGLQQGIPDPAMFFLFIWGALPVALILLAGRRFQLERSVKGISCGIVVGLLGGMGQLAMLNALAVPGGNTSVITAVTGLYPMVTAVLAVVLLRERLTLIQSVGLVLAGAAIVIFARDPSVPFSFSWHGPEKIPDWFRPASVVLGTWGLVGIFQKLATNTISAESTLIWQTLGFFLLMPFVFPVESLSVFMTLGVVYGLVGGVLTNLGSWFLFGALASGGKVSIVAPFTALYPLVVVFLAPFILQESITLFQGAGVLCALTAIGLLSA